MKIIYFIFIFILFSCEKEIEMISTDIKTERHSRGYRTDRDVRTPKQGVYEGMSSILLHSDTSFYNKAFRIIKYETDSTFWMQWWSNPDTSVLVNVSDTLRYIFTTDQTNYSCGEQRVIYDYIVKGYVGRDTIYESGDVRYRLYFNKVLCKELNGSWSSWVKFKRKL